MVFSTPFFILIFVPIFLGCYYLTPVKYRIYIILLGSWLFYGFWRLDFLGLVILTSFVNYVLSCFVPEGRCSHRRRRGVLVFGVIFNLAVLGYFKYFNFGLESLNRLLTTIGAAPLTGHPVILPIGISFYIFQSMSYLIDVYRNDAKPADNFIYLAAYIALFPQLIAGPILRYKDIALQLKERKHSMENFTRGFMMFMIGFSKKVLIADTVAVLADAVFVLDAPTMAEAFLGSIAYTLQLYFDFSGYSDMAVGLGQMLGFHFMKNFNLPYKSRSITEFWQRWHISLSTWLKDYLYIPLGGNRKGTRRTYINLMLVMVLGGFWHGAAWNFLLWGLWHGIWLVLERRFPAMKNAVPAKREGAKRLSGKDALCWLRTMVLVMLGWILFRAANLGESISMLGGLIGLNGFGFSPELGWQLGGFSLFMLFVALIVTILESSQFRVFKNIKPQVKFAGRYVVLLALFSMGIMKILADSYSPFLYFRF